LRTGLCQPQTSAFKYSIALIKENIHEFIDRCFHPTIRTIKVMDSFMVCPWICLIHFKKNAEIHNPRMLCDFLRNFWLRK